MTIAEVVCASAVLERIAAHARRDAPHECCGLLIGRENVIEEAVPVENRAADRARRYQIDPRDLLEAIKRCRGTSRAVMGAYHSHPRSDPNPSATDRAEAFGDFLYLIAGPVMAESPVQIRAYVWMDGEFRTLPLVTAGAR